MFNHMEVLKKLRDLVSEFAGRLAVMEWWQYHPPEDSPLADVLRTCRFATSVSKRVRSARLTRGQSFGA